MPNVSRAVYQHFLIKYAISQSNCFHPFDSLNLQGLDFVSTQTNGSSRGMFPLGCFVRWVMEEILSKNASNLSVVF